MRKVLLSGVLGALGLAMLALSSLGVLSLLERTDPTGQPESANMAGPTPAEFADATPATDNVDGLEEPEANEAEPALALSPSAQDGLAFVTSRGYGADVSSWRYGDNACDLILDLFLAARTAGSDIQANGVLSAIMPGGPVRVTLDNRLSGVGLSGAVPELVEATISCADYVADMS